MMMTIRVVETLVILVSNMKCEYCVLVPLASSPSASLNVFQSFAISTDVVFADQPANTRSSLERSAYNSTLKQDNPDVWHDTKQACNRCKQDVGAKI